jgi:hypothetical protein
MADDSLVGFYAQKRSTIQMFGCNLGMKLPADQKAGKQQNGIFSGNWQGYGFIGK